MGADPLSDNARNLAAALVGAAGGEAVEQPGFRAYVTGGLRPLLDQSVADDGAAGAGLRSLDGLPAA